MDREFDIRAYLAILRRRYWFLLLPAVFISIAAIVIAYSLPPVFEATSTILVESQQIPTDLASPTVTASAAERIQVIEQRLLARDNLLQIASKFHLYDYEGPNLSPTSIVEEMRQAVSIQPIDVDQPGRGNGGVIGLTLAYKYRDGTIAARVANELITSILSQNIESRLSRATETSKFLEQQKGGIEQRLLEAEQKIAEFKRASDASLPETLTTRRAQLEQINNQIADIDQKIREASVSLVQFSLTGNSANAEQLGYSLQAKQLELASVQEERDKLAPMAEKGLIPQNRIRDLDRQLGIAQIGVEALKAQIASLGGVGTGADAVKLLTAQRTELSAEAKALSDGIAKTPVVEAALNAMTRDFDNLQTEYNQAQAKLEDAQTGERLEQDRQAERFEVTDQATVPDKPKSPNRPQLVIAGVFGGIGTGIGLVVLLEMLDRSVHAAADLEKYLQLKPIAVIPYVTAPAESRRRRWRLYLLIAAAIAAVAAALVTVHLLYMPLDLLAERLLQRITLLLAR